MPRIDSTADRARRTKVGGASRAKTKDRLLPAESERATLVARLIMQVQKIVDESGDTQGFDTTAWVSRWLIEPLPALEGGSPLYLLDIREGQAVVSNILAQIQSGAYA